MTNDICFMALADPTRRCVLELLGRRPMRAGELARAAKLSPPAMSRHLRILRDAGLVDDERHASDARSRVFRLRPEGLGAVRSWMEDLQRDLDRQLRAFRQHAEGGHRA
jgi:DNA-binding transcriptional ArsR family regulator